MTEQDSALRQPNLFEAAGMIGLALAEITIVAAIVATCLVGAAIDETKKKLRG